jgi:hypothetical protein
MLDTALKDDYRASRFPDEVKQLLGGYFTLAHVTIEHREGV